MIDIYFVVIPFLLIAAAIFAASEASLFSLTRTQLESLKVSRPALYQRIKNLIYKPDELLSTVIIGNECLNILIGTFIAILVQRHVKNMSPIPMMVLTVLVTSVSLLTFSEVLPKILAFRSPIRIATTIAWPMSMAHTVLSPFRVIFLSVSQSIIRLFGIHPEPPSAVSEKDFLTLVEVGEESGSLDADEKEMIFNVFQFSDTVVSSIMTPWEKVFHIKEGMSPEAVIAQLRQRRYSRIPVVTDKERVVGILYTKELMKLLLSPDSLKDESVIKGAILPTYIVSAHKRVSNIFRDFKSNKIHIALVVDEYGRQLGIVTLEDILNTLLHTKPHQTGGVS